MVPSLNKVPFCDAQIQARANSHQALPLFLVPTPPSVLRTESCRASRPSGGADWLLTRDWVSIRPAGVEEGK